MSKWKDPDYWSDFLERVGTTAIYGLITFLTLDKTDTMTGSLDQFWLVVGLPTVLSALKNLLMNMKGERATASLVGITSNKEV
jgi:hypothetical protein